MPDPTMSAALKEAYASAPVNDVDYHTLEIWHPAFTQAIRVVRDFDDLDAMIEVGAPRNAGTVVTFVGFAFDVTQPEQTSTGVPQCVIEMDNVDQQILAQLDLAVGHPEKVTAIYRTYLASTALTGPENLPPMELTFESTTTNVWRIRAVAGFPDLLNRKFPAQVYDLATYPGLVP